MRLTLGRDIGIVMAKGVVLGVATVVLVLPAFLLLFDKQIEKHRHRSLLPEFTGVNAWIVRHRKGLVALFLLLFPPALYAQSHAEVYYKLDEALPQDMASIVANNKLKDEFDMATSHFALLRDDLPATDMNQMENAVREVEGVTSVLSYHAMLGTGIPDFFIPEQVRDMLKQEGYQLVMINSEYATASHQVSAQLEELNAILKQYDPGALITGEAALTNDLIDTSAVDFQVTNYISIAAILLIVAWVLD